MRSAQFRRIGDGPLDHEPNIKPRKPAATFFERSRLVARHAAELQHGWHFRLLLANAVCGVFPDFSSGLMRAHVYRRFGFRIGLRASILGNLRLIGTTEDFHKKLAIGPNVVVGNHVTINLDGGVEIDRNVSISPHVLIYTGTHQIGVGSKRQSPAVLARPVRIQEGAWVGLAAVILPGVTIGSGSVVAAGSVVFDDVPPNKYVRGNPAQVVADLPWGDR